MLGDVLGGRVEPGVGSLLPNAQGAREARARGL